MRFAILIVGFLVSLSVTPVSAQLNGLERFETEVMPALVRAGVKLTYANAAPLGGSGFILDGVVFSAPTNPASSTEQDEVTIERLTVENLDFDGVAAGKSPEFMRMRAEGVLPRVDGGDPRLARFLKEHDIPNTPFGLLFDYWYDATREVFTLTRLELIMPGLARVEIGATVDNVTSMEPFKDEQARAAANARLALRTASLSYDDASLLRRLVTSFAGKEGVEPEDLMARAISSVAARGAGQPAAAQGVFDGVVSFLEDWRAPVGPIRMNITPPRSVRMADILKIAEPNALKDVFGLSMDYAGTRLGATRAAAQTGGDAEVVCEPGTRFFFLQDAVWWPVTARGPAPGGECGVRVDGKNEDDVFALRAGEVLPWSIDGPGAAVLVCRRGERVLVHNKGAWLIGHVTSDAPDDQDCPVRYDRDQSEDRVPLDFMRTR